MNKPRRKSTKKKHNTSNSHNHTLSELIKKLQFHEEQFGDYEVSLRINGGTIGAANYVSFAPLGSDDKFGIGIYCVKDY